MLPRGACRAPSVLLNQADNIGMYVDVRIILRVLFCNNPGSRFKMVSAKSLVSVHFL